VPARAGRKLNAWFSSRLAERKRAPEVATTLWGTRSRLVQVTVCPTLTVSARGPKATLRIRTIAAVGRACVDAAAALVVAGSPVPASVTSTSAETATAGATSPTRRRGTAVRRGGRAARALNQRAVLRSSPVRESQR
jgi:hypothetical protein